MQHYSDDYSELNLFRMMNHHVRIKFTVMKGSRYIILVFLLAFIQKTAVAIHF